MSVDLKEENLKVILDSGFERKDINVFDKVMMQMLLDSRDQNDESLRMLRKPIFESDKPIESLNIPDSLVLKLAYARKK